MNSSRLTCFVIVAVIVIAGGILRWLVASQDPFWLDELHTAWATGATLGEVSPRAAAGNQSPLFFWMVWGTRQLLGDSAVALRALSMVAGVLLVFAAADLVWRWTNSITATAVTTWLIAIDSTFVYYGTEARPYVLLQALSVVQVVLFWKWLSDCHGDTEAGGPTAKQVSISRWLTLAALVLMSVALFYLHVTASWLLVAELLFLFCYLTTGGFVFRRQIRWRRLLVTGCLVAGLVALMCGPGLLEFREVFDRRENWSLISSVEGLFREVRWSLLWWIVLPVVCVSVFYSTNRAKVDATLFDVKATERPLLRLFFVLLWSLVPLACIALLDWLQIAPVALARYAVVGSVAIPIFAGLCVGLPGKWYGQLAVGMILVGVSLWQSEFVKTGIESQTLARLRVENWSDPIHEINQRIDKQDQPVFLFANLIEDVHAFSTDDQAFHEYLKFPLLGLEKLDFDHRQVFAAPTYSRQHFRPSDIELMRQRGGGWLLIRGTQPLVVEICNELTNLAARMNELERMEVETAKNTQALSGDNDNDDGHNSSSPSKMAALTLPELKQAEFTGGLVVLISVDW